MAKGDSTHTLRIHNFGPADPGGNRMKIAQGTLTATGNYATGGYALDLSGKIPNLQGVVIEPKAGYVSEYLYSTKKVKVYYADYDAGADGALIEVADNTDITTPYVSVRYFAWGY